MTPNISLKCNNKNMSKRVYLRALEPEDYKTSVNWRNDDSVNCQLGGENSSFPMK